jgi:hypothetical protein
LIEPPSTLIEPFLPASGISVTLQDGSYIARGDVHSLATLTGGPENFAFHRPTWSPLLSPRRCLNPRLWCSSHQGPVGESAGCVADGFVGRCPISLRGSAAAVPCDHRCASSAWTTKTLESLSSGRLGFVLPGGPRLWTT